MPRSPEAQRAYQARRYTDYQELCGALGVEPRSKGWQSHLSQLKREFGDVDDVWRHLTREQRHAWWLEKFPLDELIRIAGSFDSLLAEDEGRARDDVAA